MIAAQLFITPVTLPEKLHAVRTFNQNDIKTSVKKCIDPKSEYGSF